MTHRGPIRSAAAVVAILFLAGCGEKQPPTTPASQSSPAANVPATALAGSKTCQECHAEFYKLWSASWHGLAMQPYTAAFAKARLTPQAGDIAIGKRRYHVEIAAAAGCVREISPSGERAYPIAQVMGGKNVYYFLTPLDRGRLQVLPLAYDVHKRAWYDMAASGVRHFLDRRDAALDWTDRMFAFNTTCFNCHVTELSTNYDLASDTYHTTWSEPGISCESCHSSAKEHIRAMEAAIDGPTPKDIEIIRAKDFTPAQMNDLCATCHAKLVPLSLAFAPGDKFFDHFDLITLEHADFYPDGRDLGENYTYTSWLMSPCARSGKLDCNHCHTPSGRMRYQGEQSNQMCLPCHAKKVRQPPEHGHHAVGSKGNECIACHMPMTRFAAMGRTDHSMRPPTPATTIAFKSPNACGPCHTDHDAAWADQWVRKWYKNNYQAEPLRRAELIDSARKRQWQRLPEMLADLKKEDDDEVYKTSLVRLLAGCGDGGKWPVLLGRLHDPSPLVRSSAASALAAHLSPEVVAALLTAADDPSRLVRIRTAMALASLPPQSLTNERDRASLERADGDFIAAMQARPDDWASHANLGNFYMERQDFPAAVSCFATATKLEPRQIGPLVNASMAYSNLGQNDKAERSLRRALEMDPGNAAANFNLGLLLGEQGRAQEAERALRAALKADPQMAAAAFNLGVLLGEKNPDEAIAWCQKAHDLQPTDPKYAHTLAFYQRKKGNLAAAIELLRGAIRCEPSYLDAYLLLGEIYEQQHDLPAAAKVYSDASKIDRLPPQIRDQLAAKSREIQSGRSGK
jgi:tetratricopeptide (TPR) repeat protein